VTNIEQPIDINAKASLESKESRSILVGYRYAVDTVIFLTALKNSGKDKKRVCSRRGRRLTQISLQLNYMSYADVYLFNRRFFQATIPAVVSFPCAAGAASVTFELQGIEIRNDARELFAGRKVNVSVFASVPTQFRKMTCSILCARNQKDTEVAQKPVFGFLVNLRANMEQR